MLANVTNASLTKSFPGGYDSFDVVKVEFIASDGKAADAVYYMPTVGTQAKWRDQILAHRGGNVKVG